MTIMRYTDNDICQLRLEGTTCQTMTEQARKGAAATKKSTKRNKKRAAAAAENSNTNTVRTDHAARTANSTAITENIMQTAAAATSRNKNSSWPGQICPDRLTAQRRDSKLSVAFLRTGNWNPLQTQNSEEETICQGRENAAESAVCRGMHPLVRSESALRRPAL